ncbi:EF-hand domain-containing protein [Bythopirellula goksoeyrii]|nr:hypothetical protein [Bythopirellula goksoeyrii]
MANKAISEFDKNGDSKLSEEELSSAPGLKYCSKQLDSEGDGDGSLNSEEIASRISQYVKMRVGLTPFDCKILLNKRPLVGAKVRLIPESFLVEALDSLEGTSNEGGLVQFTPEDINMSVVPPGMYRVEVTSSELEIPEEYNVKTTLGVEVSSIPDSYHEGQVTFFLKR